MLEPIIATRGSRTMAAVRTYRRVTFASHQLIKLGWAHLNLSALPTVIEHNHIGTLLRWGFVLNLLKNIGAFFLILALRDQYLVKLALLAQLLMNTHGLVCIFDHFFELIHLLPMKVIHLSWKLFLFSLNNTLNHIILGILTAWDSSTFSFFWTHSN